MASPRTPSSTSPPNKDFVAPAGELPPLLVQSHGGPTGATSTALALPIQYWTSRGFAVLDVNYGGSTGYGRAYRQRLNDRWGIVDVDDHVNGGALPDRRRAWSIPARTAIRGWSASGYTTLATLAFRDIFRAGTSHFGISDLETMTTDTHKFESRYLDGLIGPYPDRQDIYVERSPIHHLEGFTEPLMLFQGSEDTVVPPDQAETMYEAMAARGLPVGARRLRWRRARLPPRREYPRRAGRGARLLRPGLRLHTRRRDRPGRDRESAG